MTSGGMLKTADEVLMIDKNTLNNRYNSWILKHILRGDTGKSYPENGCSVAEICWF